MSTSRARSSSSFSSSLASLSSTVLAPSVRRVFLENSFARVKISVKLSCFFSRPLGNRLYIRACGLTPGDGVEPCLLSRCFGG